MTTTSFADLSAMVCFGVILISEILAAILFLLRSRTNELLTYEFVDLNCLCSFVAMLEDTLCDLLSERLLGTTGLLLLDFMGYLSLNDIERAKSLFDY